MWGEPIWVDSEGDEGEVDEKTLLLERRLKEIAESADRYIETGK